MQLGPIGLARIFLNRARSAHIPPPPAPDFFQPQVSTEDAPVDAKGTRPGAPLGVLLGVHYEDANGEESRRRITVRCVRYGGQALYVDAFCHERRALRTFLAERMIEVVDLGTGEVFDASEAILDRFLLHRSQSDPTKTAIKECRDGITALSFLSRCDGNASMCEHDVVVHYVVNCSGDLNIEGDALLDYVRRLHPDETTFAKCIRRLSWTGGLPKMARYATRLAEADEEISPEEFRFLSAIREELR